MTRRGCAALLSIGLACSTPPTNPTLPEAIVESGARALPVSPALLPATPGLSSVRWDVAGPASRSAQVWMTDAAVPRTLVILLHGATQSTRRRVPSQVTERLLTCLAAPAFAALDPLVIAPHSFTGQWWTRPDTEFVLGLARAAQERWPKLARRTVIAGYSNGGIGAWFFARLYPEYFSAAVPMAANDTIVGATPLPVYAIHGTRDELFPIGAVRAAIASAQASGVDVTLCERYRAGHMNPCVYEPELAAAARWLERHAFPKATSASKSDAEASVRIADVGPSDCP